MQGAVPWVNTGSRERLSFLVPNDALRTGKHDK
jgi:hypothetical protein